MLQHLNRILVALKKIDENFKPLDLFKTTRSVTEILKYLNVRELNLNIYNLFLVDLKYQKMFKRKIIFFVLLRSRRFK